MSFRRALGDFLPFAAGTALVAAVAAVGLHAHQMRLGYRLARARVAAQTLRRDVRVREQQLTALTTPAALLVRREEQGLVHLDYPRGSRHPVLSFDEVRHIRARFARTMARAGQVGER